MAWFGRNGWSVSSTRFLAAVLLITNLLVGVFIAAFLAYSRFETEQETLRLLENVSQNLADDLSFLTRTVNLELDELVEDTGDSAAGHSSRFLARLGKRLDVPIALAVLGQEGRVEHGAAPLPSLFAGLSEARIFALLQEAPAARLVVSAPERSAAGLVLLMGRRRTSADGGFAGAILVAMPVAGLTKVFSPLHFAPDLRFALTNAQLDDIFHYPPLAELLEEDGSSRLREMVKAASASAQSHDKVLWDGQPTLVLFRPLAGGSLSLAVGIPQAVSLASWNRNALIMLAITGAFASVTGVLFFLYRHKLADLERERSHLRTLVQTTPELIWLKDPEGVFLAANPAFLRLVGCPSEAEILGRTDYDFIEPAQAEFFRRQDKLVIAADQPLTNEETVVAAADGQRILLETIKTPLRETDGRLIGILGIARDVTDRRRAQENWRLYAILSQADRAVVTAGNEQELFQKICDACVANGFHMAWVGMPGPDDLIRPVTAAGREIEDLAGVIISAGPSASVAQGPVSQAFLSGRPVVCHDFVVDPGMAPWRQGGQRSGWAAAAAVPFLCAGQVAGIITLYSEDRDFFDADKVLLLEDLAGSTGRALERFRLERRQLGLLAHLRASEARFSTVFQANPLAISIAEMTSGQFADVNEAFLRNFGFAREEVLGKRPQDLSLYGDAEARRLERQLLRGGKIENLAVQFRHHSGAWRDILLSAEIIEIDNGRCLLSMLADVTELKQVERALVQAELEKIHMMRLGLLGEIASTIAHEVNQPIGAAANYLQAARMTLGMANASPRDFLDKAEAQILRASETIRRVRDFAANRTIERVRREELSAILTDGCALGLLGDAGTGVRLDLPAADPQLAVQVDRVQIEQVITNLIRNAAEAMASASEKRISVAVRRIDGGLVEITIADSGPGIAESFLPELFHPFATTKAEGTGLGLSTSRAIIRACGGELWVDTAHQGGACFHFTLPICGAMDA